VPGRARFRISSLHRDEALKRAIEAGLGGNGIRSVSASSRTATVLILFEAARPLAEIEQRVRDIAARGPAAGPPSVFTEGPPWHSLDADSTLAALGSSPGGIAGAAAQALLRRHGANMLAKLSRRSRLEILIDQFKSLPVALLAGTAMLSVMTGGMLDAAIVLAVLAMNAAIGFASEAWTEGTIASLESDAFPPVRVVRDGSETAIPAEQVVPGDIIILHGGDVVPADARVIAADRLTANEAALTGESLPVVKAANVLAAARAPLGDRRNMLYRGSIITGGSGRAAVVATGDRTEISRVQALLGSAARPETPLQRHLGQLGRWLVACALAASAAIFLIGLLRGRPLLFMLRSAASLGVAAVPEGLPTMVTTALAVGVRSLRHRDLLVRRLEAIEALGSVQLVCFDKTGTLTLNRMTVTRLRWNGRAATLAESRYVDRAGEALALDADPGLARLIEICVLCNDAQPAGVAEPGGSATEIALLEAAERLGAAIEQTRRAHPRMAVLERAEGRRYMVTVHAAASGGQLIAVKGDPAAVLELCRSYGRAGEAIELTEASRAAIDADNHEMAEAGLRVLGIAYRRLPEAEAFAAPAADLVWLGMVGMADPIRRGAPELVSALQRAGIATVMLTGDQRATAVAIAAELGLANGSAAVIEGDRLDAAPVVAGSRHIYARLTPAQKLQVIEDLQRSGLRVAMVGDGVNDTPALKVADVGITLAASATGIARDVADIVLLGEDLAPLAAAFEYGRSVRLNIRRAIRFLIATNLSEILLMLFATATDLARPLTPGQLLWLNLLTDVLPAMGLALEPPDPGLMAKPLPDASDSVLARGDLAILARDAGLLAGSALGAQAAASLLRRSAGSGAVGFTSLVAAQLLYALACRPPGAPIGAGLVATLAASLGAQAAALFVPGVRDLVGPPLGAADLALSGAAGLLPLTLIRALDAFGARPISPPELPAPG
jgi:P-type Ca2+ transporter type 2C